MTHFSTYRLGTATLALLALTACSDTLDFDMRGRMGGPVDTSAAALSAVPNRPEADDRGIISYPNYQVAVARRGDTLADVAGRIGLPAAELARFNGIKPEDKLRRGEIIALPRRVAEPSPATGAEAPGPIQPPSSVDITTLAGNAIDTSDATPARAAPAAQTGAEPVRHQVARGETAFTIARLYDVSPRSLAEWNALDQDFAVREGQFLLIPVAEPAAAAQTAPAAPVVAETPPPGVGSPTPTPPSASQPLPPPPVAAAPVPEAPDLGATTTQSASNGSMLMPVSGRIIRDYAKGRNDGIDIGADAGTAVKAAASGQVAAITTNDQNIPIVVIKHPDDVLTVYTHLSDLTVKKGDAVSRGQSIGKVRPGSPAFVHFEVREGFDSVDPMTYLP